MRTIRARGEPLAALARRFFQYALRFKRQSAMTAVLVVLSPLLAAALLFALKHLVDEVLVAGRLDGLAVLAGAFVALATLKAAADYGAEKIEAGVVEGIGANLRTDLYRHVIGLSPGSMQNATPGDVLTRMSGDVERTEYLIYTGPLSILADGAAALFFSGLLIYLSPPLALAAGAIAPFLIWLSFALATPIRRASYLARDAVSAWVSLAEERLSATQIVQAFSAEDREAGLLALKTGRACEIEVKARILQARQAALIELVAALGTVVVIIIGAYLIRSGQMTVGGLGAFIGAAASLYAPVKALAKVAGRFQHAAAGALRVAELLDTPSLVQERPGAREYSFAKGRLSFEHISFSHANCAKILHDVSFSVEPGETVALVGPSGSGKSTLVRLALRLADPDAGTVRIDGRDIRDCTLRSLRQTIAPVFQDPFILSGTIASNIAYADPHAVTGKLAEAARAAHVHRFADPCARGLRRVTGHGGSRLSGGQRQRVALARALFAGAPILVLDEATAAVDSETDELIQDALERLAGRRTIIAVAHRLSSIRRADRVIVIEDGQVVETGSPSALLARSSRCRDLFLAQLTCAEAAA